MSASACPELVDQTFHSIRQDVAVGVVVISKPVIHTSKREDERERQRSQGCVPTLKSGEAVQLREIGASDGEPLRPFLRVFFLLSSTHIFFVEGFFRALFRWIVLVGDPDETVNLLISKFIGEFSILSSSTVLTPERSERKFIETVEPAIWTP